ncbi:hypothetical protein C5167_008038 [Papaver somniferum]|uniref:Glycosyltransferase 61 catalytic domain-containing protein n=1 Tax=Papaver somniferum TaxID=3469 RepID=A0A4Y7JTC7_PAPSO|nr:hypothetical protein C5167_008038 [Papaver somniferum]
MDEIAVVEMERQDKTKDLHCKSKGFDIYSNTTIIIFLALSLVTLLILFDFQALHTPISSSSLKSWSFQKWETLCKSNYNSGNYSSKLNEMTSKLRDSVTFLPLKDWRFKPREGHTWFMSTIEDIIEDDEVEYLYFPSEVSKGRILCLSARDRRDGGNNFYGLAWPESLPANATFMEGLTYVSDTYYDYNNLFHGHATFCGVKLMEATYEDDLKLETFERGNGLLCFEKAVVMRHNMGRMGQEKKREAYDLMRCKARAFCNVSQPEKVLNINGKMIPVIRLTLLMRKGPRSFKNESVVIQIFQRECEKVEGCKLTAVHSEDLSFCDQVSLMSSTDIVASPHGAQLTNQVLMDRGSSVMEFFPRGWKELAGVGQFAHHWVASASGMRHEGAWWDQQGDNICPPAESDRCFKYFKGAQVGHNETYFAEWSRRVINQVKTDKLDQGSTESPINSNICSCG